MDVMVPLLEDAETREPFVYLTTIGATRHMLNDNQDGQTGDPKSGDPKPGDPKFRNQDGQTSAREGTCSKDAGPTDKEGITASNMSESEAEAKAGFPRDKSGQMDGGNHGGGSPGLSEHGVGVDAGGKDASRVEEQGNKDRDGDVSDSRETEAMVLAAKLAAVRALVRVCEVAARGPKQTVRVCVCMYVCTYMHTC
jgi:hypothetical protein